MGSISGQTSKFEQNNKKGQSSVTLVPQLYSGTDKMFILGVTSGFELSFRSAIMKIYPFTNLCWLNEDENMQPNKCFDPIGHYMSHSQ